jgi:hypothetical protein
MKYKKAVSWHRSGWPQTEMTRSSLVRAYVKPRLPRTPSGMDNLHNSVLTVNVPTHEDKLLLYPITAHQINREHNFLSFEIRYKLSKYKPQ